MSSSISTEKLSEPRGVLRRSGAVGGSALLAGGAVGSALLMSLFASPAGAVTTFTVDTNADGVANASDCVTPVANSCSLRDALAAATTDGDVIVFDAALSGQIISLSQGQLSVDAGITITGLGSANLTVDAGGNSRVFYISTTPSGVEVAISGLSIINGDAQGDYGGGIYDLHNGDLTLKDVSITGCDAKYGGGVYVEYSDGTVEIVDSTISDNYAMASGGALYTDGGGDLVITNSIFDGNAAGVNGGAGNIGNYGKVTIVGSTFSNNYAGSAGGAFYILSVVTGDVSISGSSFIDNTATDGGGAIYTKNAGSFTVTSSTFSGNTTGSGSLGGALNLATTGQVVTVTDSLFADNYAGYGGALNSGGPDQIVTINNSTFVGNSSLYGGAAIFKDQGGSLTINMSTITENSAASGGGVWSYSGQGDEPDVTITGTILTGNTGTGGAADDLNVYDQYDAVATISNSILGVVDADITVTASNNIDATAPGFVLGLGALADNGGATETMALLAGSPAIDAGPATVPTFVGNGFDQRGTPFVRVYNGQSDIGAFESQPDPTPTTTTTVASDETVVPAFTG